MFDTELRSDVLAQKAYQKTVQEHIAKLLSACKGNNKSTDITLYDLNTRNIYSKCRLVVNHTSDAVKILQNDKYINDDFILSPNTVMFDEDSYLWLCAVGSKTFVKFPWKNIIFRESCIDDSHITLVVSGVLTVTDKSTFMEIIEGMKGEFEED